MMQINGIQFNAELIDIVRELQSELQANGVSLLGKFFDSGEDIMVCCPYHKGGQERRPSAGIRKSDGKFHCFACGETHDLDELVANCLGYSDPIQGHRWLAKNFLTVQVENRPEIPLQLERTTPTPRKALTFVSDDELDSYRYTHPYLYKRGLTDDVIELFDIGYDKRTDSITFPVRYWGSVNFSKCMFVARRQIKTKRFDIPKGIEKPLYGLYEVMKCAKGEYNIDVDLFTNMKDLATPYLSKIYVCEGLFDCLRLWCNGKFAVAGFGCLFSDYQIQQLEGLPTRNLVLALDADSAGRDGCEKLRKRIKNKLITEVVLPPNRKDIGECTDEEIQNMKEVFT